LLLQELDAYVHEEAAAGIPQADTDPADDDAGKASLIEANGVIVLAGKPGRALNSNGGVCTR
jgi:hypothetical protein